MQYMTEAERIGNIAEHSSAKSIQMRSSYMPKLKSHSGAHKRFRKTASGAIKRRGAYRNHILTKKTTKQKRRLRVGCRTLKSCDARLASRMLHGS